jgi:hypothetical protein
MYPSKKLIITIMGIVTIVGVATRYLYNKYHNSSKSNACIIDYTVDIAKKYHIDSNARKYKYQIFELTFKAMEQQYRYSLFGYCVMKLHIDRVVMDVIKLYPNIAQKHIVINYCNRWYAFIENMAGSTDNFFVITVNPPYNAASIF